MTLMMHEEPVMSQRHNREIVMEIKGDDYVLTATLMSDQSSHTSKLPDDCLRLIFLQLNTNDIFRAEEVCKRWASVAVSSMRSLDSWIHCNDERHAEYLIDKYGKHLKALQWITASSALIPVTRGPCENLQKLSLAVCLEDSNVIQNNVSALFAKLVNLKSLTCVGYTSQPPLACIDSPPETLRELCIETNHAFSHHFNVDFSKLVDLDHLTLNVSPRLGNIVGIRNLQNLVHLDLRACAVDSADYIQDIQYLRKLKTLKIDLFGMNDERSIVVDCAVSKMLENNPNLETLCLHGSRKLTDRAIQLLPTLRNLKSVSFTKMRLITLKFLGEAQNLETLNCALCKRVTNESLGMVVKSLSKLHYIHAMNCGITAAFFAIANEAVKCRENGIGLKVKTSVRKKKLDRTGFSPVLKIQTWTLNDINYSDVNGNDSEYETDGEHECDDRGSDNEDDGSDHDSDGHDSDADEEDFDRDDSSGDDDS
ncbi:uncharacterized protein LOC107043177 [Diachasma alloeum]|uniref:uncharacterized protein LOC107043177 n=1 Tax=Diachasma alloeum TaxID=454923 RepID=UPI0007381D42|nr:uncharacterized protein LOC107043177 [Diachasma alloeum]